MDSEAIFRSHSEMKKKEKGLTVRSEKKKVSYK